MTTMQALLDRFGLDADEVADVISEHLNNAATIGSAGLSSADAEVLTAGGLTFGAKADRVGRRARSAVLVEQFSLLTGPDTAEVAAAAGVSESRVRHWASGGALLAIRVGRSLRFPRFQFGADGRPLPGLPAVLTAVPKEWPVAQVAAFLTTPQAELALGEGEPSTPAQWLAAGGDAASVAALLQSDW